MRMLILGAKCKTFGPTRGASKGFRRDFEMQFTERDFEMTFTEIARTVIDLATVASDEVQNRSEEPVFTRFYDPLMPHPGPTTYRRELRDYLRRQPVDVIYMLLLTMYVGREGVRIRYLSQQYQYMLARFPTSQAAASQIVEKVPLPCYLETGLRSLAKNGIDVDKFLQGLAQRTD
jgi:hypothetical protein